MGCRVATKFLLFSSLVLWAPRVLGADTHTQGRFPLSESLREEEELRPPAFSKEQKETVACLDWAVLQSPDRRMVNCSPAESSHDHGPCEELGS